MINFKDIKKAYFLGIGGIGMSAIARYFVLSGIEVHGYDLTESPLTKELASEGMSIHYHDDPNLVPRDIDIVIYTPAIPFELKEWVYIKNTGFLSFKRSQILGFITRNTKTIAVAGTHGKTSTSSIITHILKENGIKVSAFIGGISKNLNSNFYHTKDNELFVVEADEFDRSFLTLHPHFAVITSVDLDHLDIYKSRNNLNKAFCMFASQVNKKGKVLLHKKVSLNTSNHIPEYYSTKVKSEYYADRIEDFGTSSKFSLHLKDTTISNVTFGIPGLHNIENAVAASAAALWAGVKPSGIASALKTYSGVVRRFDIRILKSDLIYIDDYAHHPNELKACIDAVKNIWPKRKITGIFQPHLFSRTRDFAKEFALSLEKLDNIILLDIYPAREKPIEGVNAEMLLRKIENKNKILLKEDEVIGYIKKNRPEVLLTLGAGDIDKLVEPLEKLLK